MNTSATAKTTKSQASGLYRDSDGVLKKREVHSFDGTKKDDNALHVITMLAVGVIGTKLLMYKKWTTDMTVVAVASVAYIAAEIMNIMNLGKELKGMDVEVTKSFDGKSDQTQIETLEKLKESYQKVKKSAETKMMLQKAAAAAFGLAVGIAAWQRLSEEGQLASCNAAILQAETTLAACTAAGATGITATEAAGCTSCSLLIGEYSALLASEKIKEAIPGPSVTKAAENSAVCLSEEAIMAAPCAGATATGVKAAVSGACSTYMVTKGVNKAFGEALLITSRDSSSLNKMLFAGIDIPENKMSIDPTLGYRNILQSLLDVFVPRAQADMVALLGLGAGALAAFFTAKTAVGRTIDTYMFTPGGRIIAWGIMTTAALVGANATKEEIDKVDGYISDIDKILTDLNTLSKGIKANNVTEQQIKLATLQALEEASIPLNSKASVKTDCIGSMGSSKCTPLTDQIKAMPGFSDLPDSFKSLTSQAAKLGDGLGGTNSISASTLANAGSLAGRANAIGKINDSLKNKINDALNKEGKPTIDFNKNERDLWGKLKSQTSKALKSKNMSAGSFLAGTGISPISNASAAIAKMPSSKNAFVPNRGATAAPAAKDKGFELDFSEAPAEEAFVAGEAAPNNENFDIGTNDINTNNGESIFKVISNRYIKSGYPKLLDEIPATKN